MEIIKFDVKFFYVLIQQNDDYLDEIAFGKVARPFLKDPTV